MARYLDTIDLPISCEAAFDALVDFSSAQRWDPSVVRASRLDRGPIAPGARFEVVVRLLGIESALEYTLVEAERPHRIVLRAEQGALTSLDEIALSPRGTGVRVTYDARIELSGLARSLDPLLNAWFQRSGARSAAGMRAAFSATAHPLPSAASVSARKGTRARSRAQSRNVPANLR
jgi:dehydrogenase/reductase SDR family protein 12